MTQPKPLTPISIEKVDFSKLDRATFYVGLGKNGHLNSFSLSFLMSNQDWVTHLYLEQSEESKCEDIRQKWNLKFNDIKKGGVVISDDIFNFFLPYLPLPSQKSEVKTLSEDDCTHDWQWLANGFEDKRCKKCNKTK